jgi:hypothetical protein
MFSVLGKVQAGLNVCEAAAVLPQPGPLRPVGYAR